jgi:hypothetical protein
LKRKNNNKGVLRPRQLTWGSPGLQRQDPQILKALSRAKTYVASRQKDSLCSPSSVAIIYSCLHIYMPPCALTAACLARTGATAKLKKPPATKTDRDSITKDEASRAPAAIARVVERNITRFFGNNLVPAAAIDVVVDDEGFTMRNRMNKDREELLDSGKKRADPSYFMDVKR